MTDINHSIDKLEKILGDSLENGTLSEKESLLIQEALIMLKSIKMNEKGSTKALIEVILKLIPTMTSFFSKY